MNTRQTLLATALATVCIAGLAPAQAAADKEKCYGLAKAG